MHTLHEITFAHAHVLTCQTPAHVRTWQAPAHELTCQTQALIGGTCYTPAQQVLTCTLHSMYLHSKHPNVLPLNTRTCSHNLHMHIHNYTCSLRTTKRVYTLQSTHTYPLVLPIYIQPNLLPFQTSTSWLTLHTPIHDHTAQSTTTHMCSHFTHSHVLTLHTPICSLVGTSGCWYTVNLN